LSQVVFEPTSPFPQISKVEILGIIQLSKQCLVHDLRDPLIRRPDPPVHGYIKDYRVSRKGFIDDLEQVDDSGIIDLGGENIGRLLSKDFSVGKDVAQDLGKRGFTGAEKAGYPYANSFSRSGPGRLVGVEDLPEVPFMESVTMYSSSSLLTVSWSA